MARMLYRRGAPAAGQKVFLAVAAYEGLGAGFGYALYHYGIALERAGIASELAIYSGNCHVDDSRNRLVRDFLRSDCTDMVFLDVDVGGPAQNVVDLLRPDRDVIAGIYPKKHGDDNYPVRLFDGELWSDRDGLIEVEAVPTGFLRMRREVLQRLANQAVHYNARNDADSAIPCIFERQIIDGVRWGGDYVFCRKWRAMGGKIYIAPEMRFEHSGEHTWIGSVGSWMRQRNGLGLVRGIKAFRAGLETPEDAADMFDAWGNPFAATPELLLGLAMVARATEGPILECGSGLSTVVLAAASGGRPVHTLEQSPIYADNLREILARHSLDATVHCAPVGDWYEAPHLGNTKWGLVFLDGPRGKGSRLSVFNHIDLSNAVVVADDVQGDGGIPQMVRALSRTHEVRVMRGPVKSFAVAAPRPQMRMAAE